MKAKTNEKKNNHSPLRRLIPAVAMLATSAVMLSTSTYAWFTMGKEVQVTGLNMTATSAGGMEISLAKIDKSNSNKLEFKDTMSTSDDGDVNDIGWKNSVVVGNYYSDIGKIKPASSVDGKTFFDATDASNKGRDATKFKLIDLGSTMAALAKRDSLTDDSSLNSDGTEGFYVDIPVHLRTAKVEGEQQETPIYYKMIINSYNPTTQTTPSGDDELFKAVRVAFISATGTAANTTPASKIIGANNVFYNGGPVNGDNSKASDNSSVTVTSVFPSNTGNDYSDSTISYTASTGTDSGLVLPYAETAGKYGHLDFTVRVWLEGESTSCFDDNAAQSWNIDLAFSMGEFTTT